MQPLQPMTRDPLPHFLCRCSTWGQLRDMRGYSNTHTTGTRYVIEHQDAFPGWRCSFTSKMLSHRTQNVGQFTDKVKDGVGCRWDLGVVLASRRLWREGVTAFIWGRILFLLENRTKQWRFIFFNRFNLELKMAGRSWECFEMGSSAGRHRQLLFSLCLESGNWLSAGTDSLLVTQKNGWDVRCLWAMGAVTNPEGPYSPTYLPRQEPLPAPGEELEVFDSPCRVPEKSQPASCQT